MAVELNSCVGCVERQAESVDHRMTLPIVGTGRVEDRCWRIANQQPSVCLDLSLVYPAGASSTSTIFVRPCSPERRLTAETGTPS